MRIAVFLALVSFGLAASHFVTSAGGQALTGPCPKSSQQGAKLGSLKIEDSDVYLREAGQKQLGHNGATFHAGDVLCTNGSGAAVVAFKHSGRKATCHLHPGAAIRLAIAKTDYVQVKLWSIFGYGFGVDFECGGKGLNIDTGQVHLVAGDPLFSVSGDSHSLVVKVARGVVKVSRSPSASGAPSSPVVFVGPMEKSVARTGAAPTAAQTVPVQALFSLVTSPVAVGRPAPAFGRPTARRARRSPALLRIRKRNLIVVGLGPGLAGSDAGDFVQNYFEFLGAPEHWAVKAKFMNVTKRMNATSLLAHGRIDVFVSQKAATRTQGAPFFGDHAGRNWLIVVNPDPVFLDALTTFLESAINTGAYGRIYDQALQKLPVYKTIAPLVFPPLECTPKPDADLTSELDLRLAMSASPSGPLRAGARVSQTVTVTNIGARVVDCVTLRLHIFGGRPLNYRALTAAGCTTSGQIPDTGELELSCELGHFGLGKSTSLQVVVQPETGSAPHTETCADVNADESGGAPEIKRGDNGACAQLVYRAPFVVGVVEDNAQEPPAPAANIPLPLGGLDPKAKFDLLGQAGFGAVVVTAPWVPGKTAPSPSELAKLQNAAMAAKLDGIDLVLAVYNLDRNLTSAQDTPVTAADRADFAAYTAALARALPTVREFIVGNEPNNEQFWSPQYAPDGSDAAASAYELLLAKAYDALKAVDPTLTVIGGALSPRGAARPKPGRDTHSPVTFIHDLGDAYGIAYRRGVRTGPIMDAFALHPIPESPDFPPNMPHPSRSPVLGIADYPVLVSLLGRAFDGTGQPGSTLPIYYTEYAIQTTVPPGAAGYVGKQGATASEKTQADFYRQAIALASCQPSVKGIFFFHGFDETQLKGWQSGVYYADGTAKSSFSAVRAAALAARTRTVSSCPPGTQIP